MFAATDHDRVYGNFGDVRVFEVVPDTIAVKHNYAHVNYGGDAQKQAEFNSAPNPRYKCSRNY